MKKLEFYTASHCAPCRQVKGYINDVKNCELSIFTFEEHHEKFIELGIRSIPHFRFIDGDETYCYRNGSMTLDQIQAKIDER